MRASAQAASSSNDETHLWGRVEGMILEITRQVGRAHALAGPRARHDLCALGESSEKTGVRRYLDHIEFPIPSRACFVFEYGIFQGSAGPPDNDGSDLHGLLIQGPLGSYPGPVE